MESAWRRKKVAQ